MKRKQFLSKIIHTPYVQKDPYGALHVPVYNNAAFGFETSEGLSQAFAGTKPAHAYSRSTNPTVEYLEQQIKNVTGAFGVTAVSSGMAAITNTIFTIAQQGSNIVSSPHIFANTYSLFSQTLKSMGIEVRFCDFTDAVEIEKNIDENTCALFFETITNPQLEIADISVLSQITKKHKILLIADTTSTPPYLFFAGDYNIDIEIISSTKFISGGATSIGGLIIDYGVYDWKNSDRLKNLSEKHGPAAFMVKLRREIHKNLGSCLSPQSAYFQSIGLETLSLRIEKCCENTVALASWLNENKKIVSVNYPGLPDSKYHDDAKKYFDGLYGSILTFELSSPEECFRFMDNLKFVFRATNMHDNRTLIIHPWSTIYVDFSAEEKKSFHINDTMMRLSVGLENVDDIIKDFEQALLLL